MKAVLLLAVLAALGALAAGCGSGAKSGSGPITVTGTTTISTLETGTRVTCKGGHQGVTVPPAGQGVAANWDGTSPSSSGELQVTHRQDGSVVAVCRRG